MADDEDWLAAGVRALERGQCEEAVYNLARALSPEPNSAPAHYYLAIALRYLQRFSEALDHVDRALEIAPLTAVSWAEKGLILGELGREEASLVCFDRSITLDPEQAVPRYNKGVALNQLGRYEEAIVTFQCVFLLPAERELVAATHAGTASALYGQGRLPEALASYDQAIVLDPTNVEAQEGRARVLRKLAGGTDEHNALERLL